MPLDPVWVRFKSALTPVQTEAQPDPNRTHTGFKPDSEANFGLIIGIIN
jgi:hypothetical protein